MTHSLSRYLADGTIELLNPMHNCKGLLWLTDYTEMVGLAGLMLFKQRLNFCLTWAANLVTLLIFTQGIDSLILQLLLALMVFPYLNNCKTKNEY